MAIGFLGISSTIFLLTPRILGQLIDEYDTKKEKTNKNVFSYEAAKYFKENPLAIVALLFIGAAAICCRAYLMHTAGYLFIYFFFIYFLCFKDN